MNERVRKLTEEASRLPPIERVELVEGILRSLDAPDTRLEETWLREAEGRLSAFRRGEIETIAFDEVVGEHRDDPSSP